MHSIHTWTELPFDNNGLVCCAFRDINDVFLDLETGILAESLPMFVATDPSLVTGVSRRASTAKHARYLHGPWKLHNTCAATARKEC